MRACKIFVIDDEPLILRSIKMSIEDAHSGFEFVGEAMNGEDALSLIEELQPDVIFSDIRMPIMDGLALIDELRKRRVPAKIVILSGHQEFEYAKRALQLGVSDYLLKPISQIELVPLLKTLHDAFLNQTGLSQVETLSALVNSEAYSLPDTEALSRLFANYRAFVAILVCSGSICTFSSNWLTAPKEFWLHRDLDAIVKKLLSGALDSWTLDLKKANEKLVLIGIREDSPDLSDALYRSLCWRLSEALRDDTMPVTIVAGRIGGAAALDLPFTLHRLQIVLNKCVRFGESRLCFSDGVNVEGADDVPTFDSNLEKLLALHIENDRSDLFKEKFAELLEQLRAQSATQFRLESTLKLVPHLFRNRSLQLSEDRLRELELEIDELISNACRYAAVLGGMLMIIDELFAGNRRIPPDKTDQAMLMNEVERFVKHNYTESLSLQTLAEKFGLAPPYLSRLFKKHKNLPPSEYIIHLRIGKAKELLRTAPSMTLKDIGRTVGYEDPYYLSRVFKSVTGVSPSEYRNERS